jgi:molybdopterin-guanine dinucleotide biosynthesis protein A
MATPAGGEQSGHSGTSGPLAAVVLAGGRATRLGGADKPAITIQGRSLLSTAVEAALNAGASRVVVVGPPRPGLVRELAGEPPRSADAAVEFTTEQPPGAGPVPAVRAGLELVSEPWLFLLAADLPFLRGDHLSALLAAARRAPAGSGAIFVDHHGHPQWLAGCWQTARLRTALGGYEGNSLGGLLGPLTPVRITAGAAANIGLQGEAPPWFDCDTSEDVAAALALAAHNRPAEAPGPATEE